MASPATRSHPPSAELEAKPVLVEDPGAHSTRQLDGKDLTIALVFSRWYGKDVVDPLVTACTNELLEKGVQSANLIRVEVSGAYEIPFAASQLITTKREALDAVVCIGCMVKGATMAFEFVSEAVTMAIMKLNVMTDTPVVFGVLTCASETQAKQCAASTGSCSSAKTCNHGVEWAQSALELAHLKRSTAAQIARKCACKCHCASDCSCSCHCTDCKCKTCTCTACECTSCVGHSSSSHRAHRKSAAACTSCGKAGESCSCSGCNCRACDAKTHAKASP